MGGPLPEERYWHGRGPDVKYDKLIKLIIASTSNVTQFCHTSTATDADIVKGDPSEIFQLERPRVKLVHLLSTNTE